MLRDTLQAYETSRFNNLKTEMHPTVGWNQLPFVEIDMWDI